MHNVQEEEQDFKIFFIALSVVICASSGSEKVVCNADMRGDEEKAGMYPKPFMCSISRSRRCESSCSEEKNSDEAS